MPDLIGSGIDNHWRASDVDGPSDARRSPRDPEAAGGLRLLSEKAIQRVLLSLREEASGLSSAVNIGGSLHLRHKHCDRQQGMLLVEVDVTT